jgi:glycosyltransferase involved in cell wall biosynthesis
MNLNISGPWNSLGYGQVVKHIITTSLKMGHNISFFPIGNQPDIEQQSEIPIIQQVINHQNDYNSKAPSIRIFHQFDLAQHVGKGPHIGFPIFELNKFSDREKHHLKSQDALFVCSEWAKGIIKSNQIETPTFVVPLGVDTEIFNPQPRINQIVGTVPQLRFEKPYTFITIGKFSLNKGHDFLIDAFGAAFKPEDDVELQLMTFNPFLEQEQLRDKKQFWLNKVQNSRLAPKIKLVDRVRTQAEVAKVMNQSDCGVFVSRGEGFNLELLEMMACDKPVIATNYSGHTQFANANNCSLVEITELEDAYDSIWFNGQGEWASLDMPQFDQLVEFMRYNYNNRVTSNEEGVKTAIKFNWTNSVNSIINNLREI